MSFNCLFILCSYYMNGHCALYFTYYMLTTDAVCLFLSSVWTQQDHYSVKPAFRTLAPLSHFKYALALILYDIIRTEKNASNRVSANSNPYSPLKQPIGTKEHGRTKLQQYSECALRELEYA